MALSVAPLGQLPPGPPQNPLLLGLIDFLSRAGSSAAGSLINSQMPMSAYEKAQTGLRGQEIAQTGQYQQRSGDIQQQLADNEKVKAQNQKDYEDRLITAQQLRDRNEAVEKAINSTPNLDLATGRRPGESDEAYNQRQKAHADYANRFAAGIGDAAFPQYTNPNPPPDTAADILNHVRPPGPGGSAGAAVGNLGTMMDNIVPQSDPNESMSSKVNRIGDFLQSFGPPGGPSVESQFDPNGMFKPSHSNPVGSEAQPNPSSATAGGVDINDPMMVLQRLLSPGANVPVPPNLPSNSNTPFPGNFQP